MSLSELLVKVIVISIVICITNGISHARMHLIGVLDMLGELM